ncbi:hypothetical protein Fcan01_27892 [Folsomia candida]|uniref:Uncharacterized protein n=1 Tax=Folsomia candida TaxID=158441 RepID=A0A226CY23_FOLCA|nr:hypothetical protein Fcan01_27892 [Folsomia candida]
MVFTDSQPPTINLAQSLFQHLDHDCQLIVAYHNNFQNSDILSTPIPSNKGIYIFPLPQINTTNWIEDLDPAIHRDNNFHGIYAISQKVTLSSPFCLIGVVITKNSDFDTNLELPDDAFSLLTEKQTEILYNILFSNHPSILYNEDKFNLKISLLIRVQLNFTRLMRERVMYPAIFKFVLNLVIVQGRDEWYHVNPTSPREYQTRLLSTPEILHAIRKNSRFNYILVYPPTDFFMRSRHSSYLHLCGYYTRKESCEAYGKNPFHLIIKERYLPRAVLFFSLVCLGNFTYGEAYDNGVSRNMLRRFRGQDESTYAERVYVGMYRDDVRYASTHYVTTMKQGYSFMACFSREELSFKIFLQPFEFPVWAALLFTLTIIVTVFVVILINTLQWGPLEATSFAQLAVIGILLEKPIDTGRTIGRISAFQFLFGFWGLLAPTLSNGYLGLSITSISSPLESTSVTRFKQLSKPGCDWGNVECQISRIKGLKKYLAALDNHLASSLLRLLYDKPYMEAYRPSAHDVTCRTSEALRIQSIRRFDVRQDFVLLPYLFEDDVFDKMSASPYIFYNVLEAKLKAIGQLILPKLELGHKTISAVLTETLRLLDLLDPWHIPHPSLENFTDTIYLKNEWDIEHALIQCGRTALVLEDKEISKELRYFNKHYPWLKFFKSESSILTAESGWMFHVDGVSITPRIFGKLYVAGIAQLLEDWPHIATQRRINITRKVHTFVEPREITKKTSLGGNIQTIFYIYLAFILLSFAQILVVELKIYKNFWDRLHLFIWWFAVQWKYGVIALRNAKDH